MPSDQTPKTMPIKKASLFSLLLLLLGGSYFLIYQVAPYAIVQPYRAVADTPPIPADKLLSTLTIQSQDSLALAGLELRPRTDSLRSVMLLVHGIGSCKEPMTSLALDLAQEGIACVWLDNRAHGQSEGRFCTYGYYEKYDIQQLLRYAQQQYPDLPVGVWGNSLGGAIALQALELEPGIHFGIIESTFTNLEQIVYDYQKRITFGVGARWATRRALEAAGRLARFPAMEVKPLRSAANIRQPVLLAHGDADRKISVEYGQQLHAALASTDKELVIVAGAGHTNLGSIGGADYWQRILSFIDRQLE